MDKILLFDTIGNHTDLLPISFTRPVCDIRVGITTIYEKWQQMLPGDYSALAVDYLREKYVPHEAADGVPALYIAGRLLPDASLVKAIESLDCGEMLCKAQRDAEGRSVGGAILACRCDKAAFAALDTDAEAHTQHTGLKIRLYDDSVREIEFLYHIFQHNGIAITEDFKRITAGRVGNAPDPSCRVIGSPYMPDGTPALFIEDGATVEAAAINLKDGPIYIGRDARVMEGSCLRGPFALCEGSKVNMLTKIYSDTTIGPMCKVGGEINNVVMLGHSNKAHDGYLGNAVIGEWCNIGAGTNASNLKNDYSKIRLWNYRRHTFMHTDLQFCGLIMADHSKAGINCMFNTATVVGVGCNIHGSGFPRVFIPSFSEGSPASGFSDVPLKKFFDIAARVMARRGLELTDADRSIYEQVARVAAGFK